MDVIEFRTVRLRLLFVWGSAVDFVPSGSGNEDSVLFMRIELKFGVAVFSA
jgi:hypothetical protein